MMNDEERLLVQRLIAATIDHPSVFMGGPSRNAMKKADAIIEGLIRAKRLVPSACGHSGWQNFFKHGAYCPDCGQFLPDKI
jgi:hypothetical protein